MQVENKIMVYEYDNWHIPCNSKYLTVKNSKYRGRITLEIDGKQIDVLPGDLEKAIRNATNV